MVNLAFQLVGLCYVAFVVVRGVVSLAFQLVGLCYVAFVVRSLFGPLRIIYACAVFMLVPFVLQRYNKRHRGNAH